MATRNYDRTKRLARADELSARILDCVLELVENMDIADVGLEQASEAAGVSVPTLVRKFGSKDGLYAAAFGRARARYAGARSRVNESDDTASSLVRAQLAIYERWGRALLYLRTRERQWPVVHEELERGRAGRRTWLRSRLERELACVQTPDDLLAQVFALTDVHMWAVFRLDLGYGKHRTQAAMEALLRGHLAQIETLGEQE